MSDCGNSAPGDRCAGRYADWARAPESRQRDLVLSKGEMSLLGDVAVQL